MKVSREARTQKVGIADDIYKNGNAD